MPKVRDVARIATPRQGEEGDILNSAWLVWKSVTEECRRRQATIRNGYYVYEGALRGHVIRLWPMLSDEERTALEKSVYAFLRATKHAQCIHTHSPTLWNIAIVWSSDPNTVVIPIRTGGGGPSTGMTTAERRVTPQEAGEHLPPGEVTIRHKETKQVTTTTAEQTESDVRREVIVQLMSETPQPVVAAEVTAATGIEKTSVRKELATLVERGEVFTREETAEERLLRFDGVTRATRAALFSLDNPVPARTKRQAVSAYIAELNAPERMMGSSEINARLGQVFKKHGESWRFTATTLSEQSKVSKGTLHNRLRNLATNGLIADVGVSKGSRCFQVRNKAKLLKELGVAYEAKKPVAKKAAATPPAPAKDEVIDTLAKIRAIVDENTVLRARVAELEAKVQELTTPTIDPGVAKLLESWTPLEG